MKIIYYSPHPHLNLKSPSGSGTHMREMITAFRKEGCEVLPVIMGGVDNPPKEQLEQNTGGIKKILKKVISKKWWRTLKGLNLLRFDRKAAVRLEKAIKEFKPDFIYERCNYLQLSGIKMANKHDIFHAMEINSPYVDQYTYLAKSRSFLESYARNIEKKQVVETDLALAVVGPLKTYFCDRYDVDPDKFLITHDAFNEDNIHLDDENQQQIKERYQLSGQTVVGYIGSIFEWHGLDKLIKAFDELNLENIKLLIVGYGEYMTNLIELTRKLGREEDIIFTGRVPKEEIFDYIALMDVCTAPDAAWYQSPVKIFEYGALGKPVMGPDTDAVREVMEPDKDGVLVSPTVEGVKQGLTRLIQNEKAAAEMGRQFQRKVLNEYTWTSNARKVIEAKKKIRG